MKEKFDLSEKYRKYLLEIILDGTSYYTVWGTDLNDNENDKLLVNHSKLILFDSINTFKAEVSNYLHPYLDSPSFENWISEEPFDEAYNAIHISCLKAFYESNLESKEEALEIIDSLNVIQDFYIQIKKNEKVFRSKLILDLKDNLYNNHFWKNDGIVFPFNTEDISKIKNALKKIYDALVKDIEFVQFSV